MNLKPTKKQLAIALGVFLLMPGLYYSYAVCGMRGDVGICGWQTGYFLVGAINLYSIESAIRFGDIAAKNQTTYTILSTIINLIIAYVATFLAFGIYPKLIRKK